MRIGRGRAALFAVAFLAWMGEGPAARSVACVRQPGPSGSCRGRAIVPCFASCLVRVVLWAFLIPEHRVA